MDGVGRLAVNPFEGRHGDRAGIASDLDRGFEIVSAVGRGHSVEPIQDSLRNHLDPRIAELYRTRGRVELSVQLRPRR